MKTFFIALFCLLTTSSWSQSDSTAYDKFYKYFTEIFAQLTEPPMQNAYGGLENSVNISFNSYNPLFLNAIAELTTKKKISEPEAVDSLVRKVLRDIRWQNLWNGAPGIYNAFKESFELSNRAVCPCITRKVKTNARMKDLLLAFNECMPKLLEDTSYVNNMRRLTLNKSLNELKSAQAYVSLYFYQVCEVVNFHWNETSTNSAISIFIDELSIAKGNEAEKMIGFYNSKQLDSLSLLFPAYKNFIPALNKALDKLNEKDIKMSGDYSYHNRAKPSGFLLFMKDGKQVGRLDISYQGNSFKSLIASVTYKDVTPSKEDPAVPPRIEELIVEPVKE